MADPSLLAIGGAPSARSLIRFPWPPFLRDSAQLMRVTLELVPTAPFTGLKGDTAFVQARPLLADFGGKSPASPDPLLCRDRRRWSWDRAIRCGSKCGARPPCAGRTAHAGGLHAAPHPRGQQLHPCHLRLDSHTRIRSTAPGDVRTHISVRGPLSAADSPPGTRRPACGPARRAGEAAGPVIRCSACGAWVCPGGRSRPRTRATGGSFGAVRW